MENTQQKKGLHPLAWVGIGCGVIILIIIILMLIGGLFAAKKLSEAAKNPEVSAVRATVFAHPDYEEVEFDEDGQSLTIREKKTGKTITASFEEIKEGKLTLTGEDGEEVTFSGDQSEGHSFSS